MDSPTEHSASKRQQGRVEITEAMRIELMDKIRARGNFGYQQLLSAIHHFVATHKRPDTNITHNILQSILNGSTKTANIIHWKLLNEVVDVLADPGYGDLIEVTPEMSAEFRTKMMRSGLGILKFLQRLSAYETSNNQPNVGITWHIVSGAMGRGVRSMYSRQWDRMQEVIGNPAVVRTVDKGKSIELTPEMLRALREKIYSRGVKGEGARRQSDRIRGHGALLKVLKDYDSDAVENLLNKTFLKNLLQGSYKKIYTKQWELIHKALDSLPVIIGTEGHRLRSLGHNDRVELSSTMVADLRDKTTKSMGRSVGAVVLIREIGLYEAKKRKPSTGLTVKILEKTLSGVLKTIDKKQWDRIHELVDHLAASYEVDDKAISENAGLQKPIPVEETIRSIARQEISNLFGTTADALVDRIAASVISKIIRGLSPLSPENHESGSISNKSKLTLQTKNLRPAQETQNLNKALLLNWVQATFDRTGKWLSENEKDIWQCLPSGDYAIVEGETGESINQAVKEKSRGLANADGSAIADSLSDFVIQYGFKKEKVDSPSKSDLGAHDRIPEFANYGFACFYGSDIYGRASVRR